jgi:hypothetical protein
MADVHNVRVDSNFNAALQTEKMTAPVAMTAVANNLSAPQPAVAQTKKLQSMKGKN